VTDSHYLCPGWPWTHNPASAFQVAGITDVYHHTDLKCNNFLWLKNVEIPQKIKSTTTIWPSKLAAPQQKKRKPNVKEMFDCLYLLQHYSQKPRYGINLSLWMNEWRRCGICTQWNILLPKEKWNEMRCFNYVDELGGHHVKWSRLSSERQVLDISVTCGI
jgi:hypothetical protein